MYRGQDLWQRVSEGGSHRSLHEDARRASFLHGHMFGDHVHEYLAPCIYEGEGEMLGMAFFKSLVKHHGTTYFEPVGKALAAAGIRTMNPINPAHLWALRKAMPPYAKWVLGQMLWPRGRTDLPPMPANLRPYAEWACNQLQRSPLEIDGAMRKHQLKLADRQCRMAELSGRTQSMIVMLATSLYAARGKDEIVQQSAAVLCQELQNQLTGRRPADRDYRAATKLGQAIMDGGFTSIAGIEAPEIMMKY